MPEDPEKKREYMRKWRAENKERTKENWRRWSEANRDNPEYKVKKREWQVANRAKLTAQERERRRKAVATDPRAWAAKKKAEREANAERYRAYSKKHYAANAEEQKRKAREWQQRNRKRRRDYLREWTPKWREENPEKYREQVRRNNQRRRGVENDAEYVAILEGDPCAYCGGSADTIDHITSIFLDGDGRWENLTAACRSCNSGKRERPLLIFMAGRAWPTTLNSAAPSEGQSESLAA